MTGEVLYEAQDRIARITINRPDRRNAINPDVVTGIAEGIRSAEAADDVNVIVLTGSGDRAFCAGGDLGGGTLESGKIAAHFSRSEIGDLFQQMRECPLPIVARVNGHALAGGFGLMLACDLVVAAREAELGTPEVNIGLWPFMISAIIRRDVPRKIALDLMLTGRRMTAEEGARWGFVNEVVERESLDKAIDELTSVLLEKSPLIIGLGKTSFYRAEDMRIADALDYLAGMLTICLESEDTIEGVTAFLQKRNPEWKGR